MVRGGRSRGQGWRGAAVASGIGLGLGLVILSPLALSAFDRVGEHDWQRLSAIGQTYGAVSALLAAAALGAVVVSIRQQRRSAQVDREHVYRTVHLELTRMLLEHPDLMDSYTSVVGASTQVDQRLNLYCNQEVLALQMGYEIGAIGERYIAGAAKEMFGSSASWQWWARVRESKRQITAAVSEHCVFDILDREWRRARPTGDGQQRRLAGTSVIDVAPAAATTVPSGSNTKAAPLAQQVDRKDGAGSAVVRWLVGLGALMTLLWLRRHRKRCRTHE